MSLVYKSIITLSALIIIFYDFKFQKIPLWIILINFTCICLLINPILLIGIFLILLLKKLNKPIDISYLILLLYIVIYYKTIYSFIFIILLLIQILCSKTNTIKFMMTIELSFLIIIFTIL